MKSLKKAFLVLSGVGGITASVFSAGMAKYILGGKRQTLSEALSWQSKHYDTGWFSDLKKESYTVKGYKGYTLHVMHCENPKPVTEEAAGDIAYGEHTQDTGIQKKKFVIITHGYTDNRYGMLKYMRIYLDRGYHCIIWDLRGHGENKKAPCTYSVLEAKDLYALIQDTKARYGNDILLGLHGESLGAATTVRVLGEGRQTVREKETAPEEKNEVDFAVADCGFSDFVNVLERVFSYRHLPIWLLRVISPWAKLQCGCSFFSMRPIDALKGNTVPLLFIHGQEDTFILPENSRRMQETTGGYSELHLIPEAGHAVSVLTDPEGYASIVHAFLDHLGF